MRWFRSLACATFFGSDGNIVDAPVHFCSHAPQPAAAGRVRNRDEPPGVLWIVIAAHDLQLLVAVEEGDPFGIAPGPSATVGAVHRHGGQRTSRGERRGEWGGWGGRRRDRARLPSTGLGGRKSHCRGGVFG